MKTEEMQQRTEKLIVRNKRATHDYEIVQKIEAGIVLQGTEVKSLRAKQCSFADAYATFTSNNNNDLYLLQFHISPYEHGNRENHEPKRQRKLLLHEREAIKLRTAVNEKGLTLIPLSLYFSGPFVKVEIGVARARKKYDKREATKERESEREINRKYKM